MKEGGRKRTGQRTYKTVNLVEYFHQSVGTFAVLGGLVGLSSGATVQQWHLFNGNLESFIWIGSKHMRSYTSVSLREGMNIQSQKLLHALSIVSVGGPRY